jgi:hypothetical protein
MFRLYPWRRLDVAAIVAERNALRADRAELLHAIDELRTDIAVAMDVLRRLQAINHADRAEREPTMRLH